MVLNSFRLRLLARVFILVGLVFLFYYVVSQEQWYVATFVSGLSILLCALEMIFFQEKINREFLKFTHSILHRDFSVGFKLGDGKSERAMKHSFQKVMNEFQKVRIERELHYQYLNTVFENVNVGLFSLKNGQEVASQNKYAEYLLGKSFGSLDEIEGYSFELAKAISQPNLRGGEVVKLFVQGEIVYLSINRVDFKLGEDLYRLVSFQDIGRELGQQELDAWKKLIRVLTHEIMNSVTPISSLSEAMCELLEDMKCNLSGGSVPEEFLSDLKLGLRTIEDRSKGLLKFVESYKDITRVPIPVLEPVELEGVFKHLGVLFTPYVKGKDLELRFLLVNEGLKVFADYDLLEQVLINLIGNAFDAQKEKGKGLVVVRAERQGQSVIIDVEDNGVGMKEEDVDKVFIPFYTTKKRGSGIGLSLSQQIIRKHGGTLSVRSCLGEGSRFRIVLGQCTFD